ncbi:MAG: glycosyl hydrolase [Saprospirales bacterium]|nr:glycosyl hydrolase [Saprospirales bacterium]
MLGYHLSSLLLFITLNSLVNVQPADLRIGAEASIVADADRTACADPVASNIIFKSTDAGQSWMDISSGLPADFQVSNFYAGEAELYLGAGKGIYCSDRGLMTPVWKELNAVKPNSTFVPAGNSGVFAFSYNGGFFRKLHGTDFWMQEFSSFTEKSLRTVYESNDGAVFIGCDNGLFKSTDQGATWKQVIEYGWVMRIVESDGVMLCQSQGGIQRSTDGGDNWEVVLNEGGVGIAVEVIENGFAAINFNTSSESRRIRVSYDGGTSWQAIDKGIPASLSIASIKQVGKYFFCGHPDGIFRSADNGKSWELLWPSIGEKVFNLEVVDGVIYAVAMDGGC